MKLLFSWPKAKLHRLIYFRDQAPVADLHFNISFKTSQFYIHITDLFPPEIRTHLKYQAPMSQCTWSVFFFATLIFSCSVCYIWPPQEDRFVKCKRGHKWLIPTGMFTVVICVNNLGKFQFQCIGDNFGHPWTETHIRGENWMEHCQSFKLR